MILIKKGRVIDPSQNIDEVLDLQVDKGKIAKIGKNIKCNGEKVIYAQGLVISPGFIDMHTHIREPGREDEEDILSASMAGVKGGYTSITAMPNTNPVIDNKSVVDYILKKADVVGLCHIYPVGAISKGIRGEELSEMGEMASSGAVAFSDDGNCLTQAGLARRAMEYAKIFHLPLILHEEEKNLTRDGQINEGYYSTILGLTGMPNLAEEIMIARDISLAELTGAKIHITHLTTKKSVELIREAKKKGLDISCDVTPHHLTLTEECLISYDTNLKVNPPLRASLDIASLKQGLKEGIIEAIATDHAPHAEEEKECEFDRAAFGMIGLETAFPLLLTELVEKKILTLIELIRKLTSGPAQILSLSRGTLRPGNDADITIFDPEARIKVDVNSFASKSKNSPFHGWDLKGKILCTITGGKIVYNQLRKVNEKEYRYQEIATTLTDQRLKTKD